MVIVKQNKRELCCFVLSVPSYSVHLLWHCCWDGSDAFMRQHLVVILLLLYRCSLRLAMRCSYPLLPNLYNPQQFVKFGSGQSL